MANIEFGTAKTVVVLSVVAACFAVLWPKIFYPMLTSSKKSDFQSANGCCDVLFETDINAFKIMTEMCGTILDRPEYFNPRLSHDFQQGKLNKEIIGTCRKEVMNMCGIDIAEFLNKKEKLGHSYKQMLDEIRSFNISICLRENFGVKPGLIGAPRRMRIWGSSTSSHLRQERPLHVRPEMLHPALREKGRAIPQSHMTPKLAIEREHSDRKLAGMRPPMGGPGHVVPPPKVGGTIGVLMPLYTIGIVIFFMYTVMKVFMRKTGGNDEFKEFHPDPEFRRIVFAEDFTNGSAGKIENENEVQSKEKQFPTPQIWKSPTDDRTRLGWNERFTIMSAITGLLTEVDQQLNGAGDTQTQYSTDLKKKSDLEEACTEEVKCGKRELDLSEQVDIFHINKNNATDVRRDIAKEETKPKVKVMGLEMMAECEGGQKWNRPISPNLGVGGHSRPTTPIPPLDSPEPQNIFLEGALPHQSQLLVSDSKTQVFALQKEGEQEPPVILSSKMTLSLINVDAALDEEGLKKNDVPLKSNEDVKSDDDNLGLTDSTLLDVDSELIDDSGQTKYDDLQLQQQEGTESENKEINDSDKGESMNYATATMTGRAESKSKTDVEDTVADVSNLEGLDVADDQEQVQEEGAVLSNGSNSGELDTHEDELCEIHHQADEQEDD